jgi:hypothetical protein
MASTGRNLSDKEPTGPEERKRIPPEKNNEGGEASSWERIAGN